METFNLMPLAVLWGVLALIVLALLVIRRKTSVGEDDSLHVTEGDARMIPHQREMAHKLEVIDKWGKLLTMIAVGFGVILAALWLYQSWLVSNTNALH